jgi:predicted nuclease of predicted toxin-antitoxin system
VAVADGLRRRAIAVTTTQESGLLSSKDESQLAAAVREDLVLVTQDADFLRIHSQGVSHCGIVYYNAGALTIGQIIKGLVLIHAAVSAEEMRNHVEFL